MTAKREKKEEEKKRGGEEHKTGARHGQGFSAELSVDPQASAHLNRQPPK